MDMRPSIVHAHCGSDWHASCRLSGMNTMTAIGDELPIEDKIDRVARIVLIAVLLATLCWIV